MPANILKMAFAILMTTALTPMLAFAQAESESKLNVEDVKQEKNKAPGEDVDEMITNNQLRAQSGSKSKYSIASQFFLYGGTIQTPLAEQRPNIAGAPTSTAYSQLIGDISGKYSFDQRHSIMAGVGIRYITPLQGGGTPVGYTGTKMDADNPYITGQYIYKALGVQNVLTVQPLFYTATDWLAKKYLETTTVQQLSAYELGKSGLTLGLATAIQGNTFSVNQGDQNDVSINVDPYVEYRLTDMVNLRTVFNLWNYDHIRAQGFDNSGAMKSWLNPWA